MADDFMAPTTDPTSTPSGNYIDEYTPPAMDAAALAGSATSMAPSAPAATPSSDAVSGASESSQSLEDQNIFTLLGVEDGSDEEKESFLDELQQVIWEDFLENDVELLLTEQELTELKQILSKPEVSDLQKQEDAVVFLEKLIPDLEEIMLEKALELKEAMVRERLAGMKDFYSSDPSKNDQLSAAEAALGAGKWRDAATMMNLIK